MTDARDFIDTRDFTPAELRDCAHREVTQRRRVYARFVEQGKWTQARADREIAMMMQIEADYARRAEARAFAERLI